MTYFLKQTFFFFFVGLSLSIFGQIPEGYYDSASDLTGSDLKTALYKIIRNPDVDSYNDIWEDFKKTDKHSDGTVWDIYSDSVYEFNSDQCGNYNSEGDCYNREHSFPKSWFDSDTPMYSDLFHIYPSDGYVNSIRSNLPYGEVGSATYTSSNGSKKGDNTYGTYTGTVFEPADEYKGDLARTYFYMVTCYENLVASWEDNADGADAMLNGTTFPCFEDWSLQMLIDWNDQDPVSQKEINRNDSIYKIQGNRNPFIDHPEYVCLIWESDCSNSIENSSSLFSDVSVSCDASSIAIDGTSEETTKASVKIYNELGQALFTGNKTITTGQWHIAIPVNQVNNLLLITITTDNGQIFTKKIIPTLN